MFYAILARCSWSLAKHRGRHRCQISSSLQPQQHHIKAPHGGLLHIVSHSAVHQDDGFLKIKWDPIQQCRCQSCGAVARARGKCWLHRQLFSLEVTSQAKRLAGAVTKGIKPSCQYETLMVAALPRGTQGDWEFTGRRGGGETLRLARSGPVRGGVAASLRLTRQTPQRQQQRRQRQRQLLLSLAQGCRTTSRCRL